jgi:uncharacterized membrane protein
MDVMKRIQGGGKALYIYAEPWEVEKILSELSPDGLMMVIPEVLPEEDARELLTKVSRLS